MALAEVQLEGSGAAAAAQMRAAVPESVSMRRVTPTRSTSIGRDPASRPDCSFLPRDDAAHKYRRQIIFDEDNANSIFRLGSQRVDQNGVLVADGRNIAPAQFPHAGANGDTGDDFPPGPHVCATLHRGEVWELINSTDELHNFHIHQDKFRLARRGDPGVPDGGDSFQPFQDPSHLLDGLVADDPQPDPSRDLWHDTFPVPPRKGDVNGRVFVFIPFEAEEQVGRFVFHCHILEHEDDGMMAAMEVVHEIPERTSRQEAGVTSSARDCSISPMRSNGSRPSRSSLLTKVKIGTSHSRQTSKSLRVCSRSPLGAGVEHNDRAVDRGQGAVGVLAEIPVG
jgi:hypothetical protein